MNTRVQRVINKAKMYKDANLTSFALGAAFGGPASLYLAKKFIKSKAKQTAKNLLTLGGGLGAGIILDNALRAKRNDRF
jgi:hypothetical protein